MSSRTNGQYEPTRGSARGATGAARPARGRPLARDERGSTATEFALILPALLLLMFGVLEIGRVLWTQNALNYSVAEAARCASVDTITCNSTSAIQSYAASRSGAGIGAGAFSVSTPSCGNQVAATYPTALDIPFFSYSITLTAKACYPV